jgi:hypothetical protein
MFAKGYLALITAIALGAGAPHAEETLHGSKLICDTVEQVETYVKADEGSEPNLMSAVNANGDRLRQRPEAQGARHQAGHV